MSNLKNILHHDLLLFGKSIKMLEEVFHDFSDIHIGKEMNKEQQYLADTLSVRYIRSFDLIENKIFKTILTILGQEAYLSMDIFNMFEKMGIIKNSRQFYKMKQIKNRVVHEYAETDWLEIIAAIRKDIPVLLATAHSIINFANNLIKNPDYDV